MLFFLFKNLNLKNNILDAVLSGFAFACRSRCSSWTALSAVERKGLWLGSQASLLARACTLRRKATLKIGHTNLISLTVVKRDHRLLLPLCHCSVRWEVLQGSRLRLSTLVFLLLEMIFLLGHFRVFIHSSTL